MRTVTLADVIFPAFAAGYALSAFVPLGGLLALASEVVVFRLRERGARLGPTIIWVVVANLASWIVGFAAVCFLPSGLIQSPLPSGRTILQPGPRFDTYAYVGFFVDYLFSCVIEFSVLYPVRIRVGFSRLLSTVVLANVVSYVILAAVVLISWSTLGS